MLGVPTTASPIPAGATTPEDTQQWRDANGWSMEEAAVELLDRFDRNGDGMVSDDRFLGMRILSEARASTWSEHLSYGPLVDRPQWRFVRVRDEQVWSLDRLVARADVNGDHIATRTELDAVLRTYDADGDGRLSADEFGRVRAELGATKLRSWRWIEPIIDRSHH
jgi:hypothetical protein